MSWLERAMRLITQGMVFIAVGILIVGLCPCVIIIVILLAITAIIEKFIGLLSAGVFYFVRPLRDIG